MFLALWNSDAFVLEIVFIHCFHRVQYCIYIYIYIYTHTIYWYRYECSHIISLLFYFQKSQNIYIHFKRSMNHWTWLIYLKWHYYFFIFLLFIYLFIFGFNKFKTPSYVLEIVLYIYLWSHCTCDVSDTRDWLGLYG